jgi:hypothetical protein
MKIRLSRLFKILGKKHNARKKQEEKEEEYNRKYEQREWPQFIFHGGCHHCTQQQLNPIDFCMECCFFDSDWKLHNLNNKPPDPADVMRDQLKRMKKEYIEKNRKLLTLPQELLEAQKRGELKL